MPEAGRPKTMAERTSKSARVGICLYPGVWASSATLAKDVVQIASVIARARPGSGSIEAQFLGAEPSEVATADGLSIRAEDAWDRADVDLLVLPSLAIPFLEPARRPRGLSDSIARQHDRGCSVLAITTGSWLLAETGLLDGHTATTHWASLERCRGQYPRVSWTSEQPLAVTGRLVTARDMSASATALCHVIGRVLSAPIAERTYQYALVSETGADALPLLHTIALRDHGDAQVLAAQDWLEAHYGEPIVADRVARMVHMSARNLRRRFLDATGMTLVAYLTEIRLARARALLLATNEPVSQIAYRVGYEDASTFTALFKERHGSTPSAYRKSSTGPLA